MSQHSSTDPAENSALATVASRRDWWRDAVIYQVYPRSFADSNGDGMGDLEGVRSRLPYLRDLGVDAVWLSPFYASPQADAGYDVADYRAVDPMFGNLLDADALIRDAHDLGLRIIVDLVPNHSSDQHEWFKRAVAEGPGSPLRERYHFRPGKGADGDLPPNDWESIFGGPAWTRVTEPDGKPGDWYLHLFAPEQPDFNWDHPAVGDEFRSILRFWLDMGVDGFRVDVAHGLVKAEGLPDIGSHDQLKLLGNDVMPFFDQDGVHEIYREWRLVLDEYAGDRIFVAEAWTPTVERTANYVRPDELHQAFNFQYLSTEWDAAELKVVIDHTLDAMRPVNAPATWVLSNHDVTRHATRFANEPGLGTQIRVAGDRELGLRRARAATLLMLALPGSAYIYQGEELGLPDVVDLPDEVRQDPAYFRGAGQDGFRDGCRVPIPWTRAGSSYGFGSGGSWLPQPTEWAELSVEAQTGVPGSTLELYRSALAVRREQPGLGAGDAVEWLKSTEGVLAFRRGEFVCVANTTGEAVRIPAYGRVLVASGEVTVADDEAKLPGDTTVWWAMA
ncbi:glycoside hydrolase family 13 protein [Streptomyces ipomoeae]|uniref:Alpha amylase, catalytic domain protein n=2 Tax=Streptomyces ipomoeae TaxID=103232 RepID=L1KPA0_9ACTN|nr:glycoside hydrolase family 13 protein [Streptomyces ipomoeae]EKX62432.1 alpha amylase, catalytic domain protein [Streptomyces ipomoeae 91-03]MDX2695015.1 glycoside hydrolase family 13 protein [Streptomyces ipomoeae]MDX2822599.1 glycoside hydrolase family 13 protein [Streptomyces ipomoeae]MDX2840890.1 glycoside hydrolase family 13 protein [Streptomyces ipomoeae]MDX2875611.1 glycoside hydrolase family 13 protein [Streptomyces ipomoeae]